VDYGYIMAALIITDIKCSKWDVDQNIITAIVVNADSEDLSCMLAQAKELCRARIILESATVAEDLTQLGVKKGDLYIRMQSSSDHGLKVGDELAIESKD
jgi:hypothetical protein